MGSTLRRVASLLLVMMMFFFAIAAAVEGDEAVELLPVEGESVVVLTSSDFANKVKEGVWLVEFFAPWCPHCQSLAPTWSALADQQRILGNFKVASVDCEAYPDVGQIMEIGGFPTIYLFHGEPTSPQNVKQRAVKFNGMIRSLEEFTKFVEQKEQEVKRGGGKKAETKKASLTSPTGPAEPKPIELTNSNFDAFVAKGKWIVEFYAPWCPHCQALTPTWEKLAAQENPKGKIKVAQVNCDDHSVVCGAQGVSGYPTVMLYINGKAHSYEGSRTVDALANFADEIQESLTKEPVETITGKNFNRKVLLKPATWLLDFYTPWCGHCKELAPKWDKLASNNKDYGEPVRIGKVNCEDEGELCERFGVDSYPSIKMIQIADYTGPREVESIESWYNRFDGSSVAPSKSDVVILDANSFNRVKKGTWLVDLYAPWCGHCKQLAPVWEQLASTQKGNYFVAKVNCEQGQGEIRLCEELNIESYPTVLLFVNGRQFKYTGERTPEKMADFVVNIETELEEASEANPDEGDVIPLTEEDFHSKISKGYWFVDFYATWCTHCKDFEPVWEDLALIENPQGRINIASVNCVTQADLCDKKIGITTFPTLQLYHNGKPVKKFSLSDGKTLQALQKFLKQNVKIHDEL